MSTGPAADSGLNSVISDVLNRLPFSGLKTYLAAAGLFGLALYQASTGDYVGAYTSVMAALAAAGLRHAIAKA